MYILSHCGHLLINIAAKIGLHQLAGGPGLCCEFVPQALWGVRKTIDKLGKGITGTFGTQKGDLGSHLPIDIFLAISSLLNDEGDH